MKPLYGFILISLIVAGCTTPYIIATQAVQRGDELSNSGQFKEALSAYQQFTTISPQLGVERDPVMEAAVFRKMSATSAALGQYPAAISYLRKSLALDSARKDAVALAEDHRQLGLVHGYQGDLRLALKHLTRAHGLLDDKATSSKETLRAAAAENDLSLAQLHLTLGNYPASINFAQASLRLAMPVASAWSTVADAQLVLGIIYRETGDWKLSEKFLLESRDVARRNGITVSPQEMALGELAAAQGQLQTALQRKMSALEEARKANITPQILQAHLRLGDTYRQLGDEKNANYHYQQAITLKSSMDIRTSAIDLRTGKFQDALQSAQREGTGIVAAIASLRIGETSLQRGKTDSARMMLAKAKDLFAVIGSPDGKAKVLVEESKLEGMLSQWNAAQQAAEAATRITRQPDILWQGEFRNGIAWEAIGRFDSARNAYQRSIGWIDRMRANLTLEDYKSTFADSKVEVYGKLLQLLLDRSGTLNLNRDQAVQMAFSLNEQSRSRAFLDMLGNRKITPRQNTDTTLLRQEQMLKLKISRLSRHLHHQPTGALAYEQLSREWEHANTEHQQVIRKIKLADPAYGNFLPVDPPSVQEVVNTLDPSTALIEYWIGPESLNIWVIRKSGMQVTTVQVSQLQLTREITRCRNAIAQQITELSEQSLEKLSQWLIEPVAQQLRGVTDLIIVPHRKLHFLPFQALKHDSRYLIETFQLRYSPSAAVYAELHKAAPATGSGLLAMALGNSALDGFNSLPGSAREVKSIAQLFKNGRVRSETEFTESALRRTIGEASQIHLATHGVLNVAYPLNSYLLMHPEGTDDGRLTVNEILDLRLKARLVTLSACETGLGAISEGDELVGLSRSFLYAGSAGIIVSLWKVDDATTAWLMTRFYQHLNAGSRAPAALALAQRDLIHFNTGGEKVANRFSMEPELARSITHLGSEVSRNPYYWAPFLFIGNDLN